MVPNGEDLQAGGPASLVVGGREDSRGAVLGLSDPYDQAVSVRFLSAVAGILSADGGLRTVVAWPWTLEQHLEEGEKLFIVPDLWVEEPVPFNSLLMHHCIRMAHATAVRALAPENPCGECRQCCVTLYIAQGEGWERPSKPSHSPCQWCDRELGCLVYFNRPAACRKFRCLWLVSQDRNWRMGPELRPDRCGVILTGPEPGDPEWLLYAHPSAHHPGCTGREPMASYLKNLDGSGYRVTTVRYYYGERT